VLFDALLDFLIKVNVHSEKIVSLLDVVFA